MSEGYTLNDDRVSDEEIRTYMEEHYGPPSYHGRPGLYRPPGHKKHISTESVAMGPLGALAVAIPVLGFLLGWIVVIGVGAYLGLGVGGVFLYVVILGVIIWVFIVIQRRNFRELKQSREEDARKQLVRARGIR